MMARRGEFTSWRPEWPPEFPGVVPEQVTARTGADNRKRNPQRTASTAAALMIGLALVTLVADACRRRSCTFTSAVDDIFTGDYAITAQNNFTPIPIAAAEAAATGAGRDRGRQRPHGRRAGVRARRTSSPPSTRERRT